MYPYFTSLVTPPNPEAGEGVTLAGIWTATEDGDVNDLAVGETPEGFRINSLYNFQMHMQYHAEV